MNVCKRCEFIEKMNSTGVVSITSECGCCKKKRLEFEKATRLARKKFTSRVRSSVGSRLRRKGYKKNSPTADIIGCSFEELWAHLKKTWRINYNTEFTGQDYHIDHIVPLIAAKSQEEFFMLNHYTNLQLLTPKHNLSKNDSLTYKTNYSEQIKAGKFEI